MSRTAGTFMPGCPRIPTVRTSRSTCYPARMLCRTVGCEVGCEVMEAPRMPKVSVTPVDEVRLYRAPLAKVVMPVQYSRTPQLVTDDAEALIADALRRYPVRRRQITAAPSVVVNGQQ